MFRGWDFTHKAWLSLRSSLASCWFVLVRSSEFLNITAECQWISRFMFRFFLLWGCLLSWGHLSGISFPQLLALLNLLLRSNALTLSANIPSPNRMLVSIRGRRHRRFVLGWIFLEAEFLRWRIWVDLLIIMLWGAISNLLNQASWFLW